MTISLKAQMNMNIDDIMTLFNLQFFIIVSILKFKRIFVSCYQGNGFDFCDRFTDTTHIKLFSHFTKMVKPQKL